MASVRIIFEALLSFLLLFFIFSTMYILEISFIIQLLIPLRLLDIRVLKQSWATHLVDYLSSHIQCMLL